MTMSISHTSLQLGVGIGLGRIQHKHISEIKHKIIETYPHIPITFTKGNCVYTLSICTICHGAKINFGLDLKKSSTYSPWPFFNSSSESVAIQKIVIQHNFNL